MSLTFTPFNCFCADRANKIHNLSSDQLVAALTDTLPVATNAVQSDITEISYTNISSRNLTTSSSTQTSGTYTLKLSNLTLTASGVVPQFRYVAIYNNTASGKNLLGWIDLGVEINMINTQTLTLTFDATNGVFQST